MQGRVAQSLQQLCAAMYHFCHVKTCHVPVLFHKGLLKPCWVVLDPPARSGQLNPCSGLICIEIATPSLFSCFCVSLGAQHCSLYALHLLSFDMDALLWSRAGEAVASPLPSMLTYCRFCKAILQFANQMCVFDRLTPSMQHLCHLPHDRAGLWQICYEHVLGAFIGR